jgi:hypothetical protein
MLRSSHAMTAATHQVYDMLLRVSHCRRTEQAAHTERTDMEERDRGAVSLEQVLWFVAAGVSVAVVAGIIWTQIRDQAETPVVPPQAP